MWIESHDLSTVRRRIVSPPGYQSPALGDSVPVPGLQEVHQRVTLQPGVTTSTLSCVPRLFASVISSIRTHREVDSEPRISHSGNIWGSVYLCIKYEYIFLFEEIRWQHATGCNIYQNLAIPHHVVCIKYSNPNGELSFFLMIKL